MWFWDGRQGAIKKCVEYIKVIIIHVEMLFRLALQI
jgi:hypothetical protein